MGRVLAATHQRNRPVRVLVQVSKARRAEREADAGQGRVDAGSRRLVFGGRGRPLAAARRSPLESVEQVLTAARQGLTYRGTLLSNRPSAPLASPGALAFADRG
jgi:hypothetical protein